MSRSLFASLAAAVTLAGLAAVVCGARLAGRRWPRRSMPLAVCLLLGYGVVLVLRPSTWLVTDLAVLAGATGGVLWLERALRTPGAVATFLAVAAVADILSMSAGPSRMLVERYREGTSDWLLYLTLAFPRGARPAPIVGIGDLFVGGAAAAALLRLGLRPLEVMVTMAAGLLGALAFGLWRGGAPAVPFIAIAVFLLVQRHSARSESRAASDAGTPGDSGRGA